jgi:hypothetical protein
MLTEKSVKGELELSPFKPLRIHLVSGKTLDVVREGTAWPLRDRLLVFRNPAARGVGAEGYDVVAYNNIERIEHMDLGKRSNGKRKHA